jgi:hypothetical protein
MTMHNRAILAVAILGLAGASSAQQVEYVTRGNVGGHAIRFGSNPIRATLPQAYVRVNNAPHAVGSQAKPNRVPLNVRYVKIHGSGHVIPTIAVDQAQKTGNRQGPAATQPTAKPKVERTAPSRHDLMIYALMRNKLDCHR